MSSSSKYEADSEKGFRSDEEKRDEAHIVVQQVQAPKTGIFAKLWDFVLYIDRFGVEVRGIERVLPQDRSANSIWDLYDCFWLWMAANCTVSLSK